MPGLQWNGEEMINKAANTAKLNYYPLCPECSGRLQATWGAYVIGDAYHFKGTCVCEKCRFSESFYVDKKITNKTDYLEADAIHAEAWAKWSKIGEEQSAVMYRAALKHASRF